MEILKGLRVTEMSGWIYRGYDPVTKMSGWVYKTPAEQQ